MQAVSSSLCAFGLLVHAIQLFCSLRFRVFSSVTAVNDSNNRQLNTHNKRKTFEMIARQSSSMRIEFHKTQIIFCPVYDKEMEIGIVIQWKKENK